MPRGRLGTPSALRAPSLSAAPRLRAGDLRDSWRRLAGAVAALLVGVALIWLVVHAPDARTPAAPQPAVKLPEADLDAPRVPPVAVPEVRPDRPRPRVDPPSVSVDPPSVSVDPPSVSVDPPSVSVDPPSVSVDRPRGGVDLDLPGIGADRGATSRDDGPDDVRRRVFVHDHHWSIVWLVRWPWLALAALVLLAVGARVAFRAAPAARPAAAAFPALVATAAATALVALAVTVPDASGAPMTDAPLKVRARALDDGSKETVVTAHSHHLHPPIRVASDVLLLGIAATLIAARRGLQFERGVRRRRRSRTR